MDGTYFNAGVNNCAKNDRKGYCRKFSELIQCDSDKLSDKSQQGIDYPMNPFFFTSLQNAIFPLGYI